MTTRCKGSARVATAHRRSTPHATPRLSGWTGMLLAFAITCGGGDDPTANFVRGPRLPVADLPVASQAAVYDAAVRASFNVEPGLVLMAHPRLLPRTTGYEGGEPMPPALLEALRARGVAQGTCDPKHQAPRDTPRCPGAQAGYVVRASQPFRAAGDTIQIHFAAEAFAAEQGARPQALRFEKIYQMVGSGTQWRVAREARVREQEK